MNNCSKLYPDDFNMVIADANGEFVRIHELNQMISCGALTINREKLEEYKFDTTVIYDKKKYTKEEAMHLWKGNL